jgi:hypothetical protein
MAIAECQLPIAAGDFRMRIGSILPGNCRMPIRMLVPHWGRPKVRIDQSAFANRQSEIVTAIGNRQSLDTLLVKLVND